MATPRLTVVVVDGDEWAEGRGSVLTVEVTMKHVGSNPLAVLEVVMDWCLKPDRWRPAGEGGTALHAEDGLLGWTLDFGGSAGHDLYLLVRCLRSGSECHDRGGLCGTVNKRRSA